MLIIPSQITGILNMLLLSKKIKMIEFSDSLKITHKKETNKQKSKPKV